jgi:L-seryl-tRNA(Ser) seleniumtransferase
MLFERTQAKLKENANKIIKLIDKEINKKYNMVIQESKVEAGSGSLPTEKISSIAISIYSKEISSNTISNQLRLCSTPILTYIKNDKVYIDLKAITDSQLDLVAKMINSCL